MNWDTTQYLLAAVLDALHVANWQRGSRKGTKPPDPVERPGAGPKPGVKTYKAKRSMSSTEIDSMFGGRDGGQE